MINKKLINMIANQITKNIKINKIFVFGSYAYGNAKQDSDLDLCVITELGNKRKIDIMREIRKDIRQSYIIPIDVLVYDVKEFDERASHQNTLEYKILSQGILVHG